MTEIETATIIRAIRLKASKTGGWGPKGRWIAKLGLTRMQVDQWATRKRIPTGWRLALKAGLKLK